MEWKTENKFLKFFSLCVSSKVSKPLSIQLYMSEALNKVVYVCSIATHTKKKKQQNEWSLSSFFSSLLTHVVGFSLVHDFQFFLFVFAHVTFQYRFRIHSTRLLYYYYTPTFFFFRLIYSLVEQIPQFPIVKVWVVINLFSL